jgi:hypothetical protein
MIGIKRSTTNISYNNNFSSSNNAYSTNSTSYTSFTNNSITNTNSKNRYSTPIKKKKSNTTYIIKSPQLLICLTDNLRCLINNLLKSMPELTNNNLNKLVENYEKINNNNKQIIYQPILPTGYNLNLSQLTNVNKKYIASGAQANVFNLIGKQAVLKQFKIKSSTNSIGTSLLGEFYASLLNYKIQTSLPEEYKKYFNQILQMYVKKEKGKKPTLLVLLEKCDGDLVAFTEKQYKLNINQACVIFHKLCYSGLMMLYSLKKLKYVHRDIKPDNILYKIKNNNDIEFQLADFSTCVPYETETTYNAGTDEFIGPLFVLELYEDKKANLRYSFDWYSMALTLFKMFIYFFNKNVVFKDTSGKSVSVKKYFPFTNDDSTIQSKISIWSNKEKYDKQEMLLQSFLDVSLREILNKYYPSVLTEINKKNLQDDLLIIFRLFLSNNPFPNSNQYTEEATFQQIKAYLGIS